MNDATAATTADPALEAALEGRTIGIGHNNPAETVAAEYDLLLKAQPLLETYSRDITGKYLTMAADVATLLGKIAGRAEGTEGVPLKIETDTENGRIAAFMEDLRKTGKAIQAYRVAEKAPYLEAERAVDGYFNSFADRVAKTQEILQARGDDYTRRKAAHARAEAQRVADAERARLADIAAAAQRERDTALAAAAAAARARKPENIEALETKAVTATQNAAVLQIDEMVQAQAAEEAQAKTLTSTADLTRTRFETGHMATGKQVGFVEIRDIDKIDLNLLRPYLNTDHVLAALKKYAKQFKHAVPEKDAKGMEGATIELRDAADYR